MKLSSSNLHSSPLSPSQNSGSSFSEFSSSPTPNYLNIPPSPVSFLPPSPSSSPSFGSSNLSSSPGLSLPYMPSLETYATAFRNQTNNTGTFSSPPRQFFQ